MPHSHGGFPCILHARWRRAFAARICTETMASFGLNSWRQHWQLIASSVATVRPPSLLFKFVPKHVLGVGTCCIAMIFCSSLASSGGSHFVLSHVDRPCLAFLFFIPCCDLFL